MEGLNIEPATHNPKATEEIDGMIAMISTLIEKGYAYEKNGTVYFRTRKFKNYGQLSKKNLDDMRAGIRIAVSDEKEDAMDFVLWKPKKEGEPAWVSPWGEGRQAGISNVLKCLRSTLVIQSTFMQAERT